MKKIISALAALAVGLGLAVVAVPLAASATHPQVSGFAVCNTQTGNYDVTWSISGDPGYPGVTWEFVSADRPSVASQIVGKTGTGGEGFTATETVTSKQTLFLEVGIQFSNHSQGDIVTKQGKVVITENCTPPVVLHPSVSFNYSATCGSLSLTTSTADINPSWYYGIKATVDGTMVGSAVLQGNGTKSSTITFDEDSYGGSVDVVVETYASTEQDLLPDGWSLGEQHVVTVATDCQPPLPQDCMVLSGWFTEADDVAPVATLDGLAFRGGSGQAAGYGVGLSGNLQGLPAINYVASGDLDLFYPRIVIDSSADGGWTYQSLTVTSEGEVNGSSVAYSNKLGTSKTLSEWAALYPHNQLVAFFFSLDSAAPEGTEVILESVSSACGSASWTVPQPEPLVGTDTWTDEPVCDSEGPATVTSWASDWTQGYVRNQDNTAWVLGNKVPGEAYPTGTVDVEGVNCVIAPPPTASDLCGTSNDKVNLPEVEGVDYTVEWNEAKTSATVTAAAQENYILVADGDTELVTEWTFDFTNDACPLPPTTPKQELAQTGLNPDEWLAWGGIGALAILAGLLFTVNHLRHRREQ